MSAVLTDITGFILAPAEAAGTLAARRRYGAAFAGYAAGALALYLWGLITEPQTVTVYGVLAMFAVLFTAFVFKGFLYAAVAHASLSFMGGRGSAAGLFIIMGLTEFAALLLVPLGLVAAAANFGGLALGGLFYMAVLVLQYYMLTVFIRRTYLTSTGRALTALFAPWALLLGLAFLLVLALVGLAVAGLVSVLA